MTDTVSIAMTADRKSSTIVADSLANGRALLVRGRGELYIGSGNRVLRRQPGAPRFEHVATIPFSMSCRMARVVRLAARLTRAEIRSLAVLSDGAMIAATRNGVFATAAGNTRMRRASIEGSHQPIAFPMTISVGPKDRIIWGEYDSQTAHGRPVRVFVSDDHGATFAIARQFPEGEILHVHNLVWDPSLEKYWVFSGDYDDEPGIGLLDGDLKGFEWVVKGEQSYRAVEMFDFGDRIVYGMDSHLESDAVMTLDKATGRVERGAEIDGSCIYACKCGGLYVLSTTVEPSKVNRSRFASIWVSRDGDCWTRVLQAEKDRWDARYFQYGSLVLPRGSSDLEHIVFSGQAVRGFDGKVFAGTLDNFD